ncbi:MAG: glutamine-hydrolyzing GMP synthase [Chitinophagales bacterium]|nr:glutamine-hydrolyzing GMP synthase [Chitinophagales bacterium]
MHSKILIYDFGSQYTQLIARRIRELNIYCEIYPYNSTVEITPNVKGVILSGSPFSVLQAEALPFPIKTFIEQHQIPILTICYGAQLLAHQFGGTVEKSNKREYGRAMLDIVDENDILFKNINNHTQVWMSHGDSIIELPLNFTITAKTSHIPIAAFKHNDLSLYGIQFHPEVTHTQEGKQLLRNFCIDICACVADWTPNSFIEETVQEIKETVGNEKVVLGLSGGVDSSVAALLLNKAIGNQLVCIFVNNGLLRYQEYETVLENYQSLGLNIIGVDASQIFYDALKGLSEPEAKRKAIGKAFIDVFQAEASKIDGVQWLAQGTIYPDIIESVSVHGPSATIKSHHNVGGLPEKMHLKIIEPLKRLFKDEVRRVGAALFLPENILNRHPFPGPGLAIRILGEITENKINLLQKADFIFIEQLKAHNLYDKVWQAGTIFLPIQSVGVMGDERTYENVVALRAVTSVDGMTADWCHLPYEFLATVSNKIINEIKGINRVVYDISSKPPATIEWE